MQIKFRRGNRHFDVHFRRFGSVHFLSNDWKYASYEGWNGLKRCSSSARVGIFSLMVNHESTFLYLCLGVYMFMFSPEEIIRKGKMKVQENTRIELTLMNSNCIFENQTTLFFPTQLKNNIYFSFKTLLFIFPSSGIETPRNKRKLAVINRDIDNDHPRKNQVRNTNLSRIQEDYIIQLSEEIEVAGTKNCPSRTKARILGTLTKLDEFRMNPHARVYFGSILKTSLNSNRKNQKTKEDRSQNDPHGEVGVSLSQYSQEFSQTRLPTSIISYENLKTNTSLGTDVFESSESHF